ncbi:MAG: hypothetical protein A3C53_06460 [Omnitrophica WOR_2 bacterium RIFCSPHIGHO2_02_FULL_68_15]|nr:MAG: hypothetical protein A3C53_06460 [Omnitrophica WOR_2 bacterium RIFCSPHIGHO2_02_FULL_68_15]
MVGWAVAALLSGAAAAEAASGDADGTYTVTVTKIEASKDAGVTYVTLFSGSQAINIASATAGATAASLVSGAALAPGTYTAIRTTMGATLSVKGYVNIGGSTYYTDGGSDSGAFTANAGVIDTPGGDYAISTFTIPENFRTNTDTSVSITVQASGTGPTCNIAFDTSSVITNSGGLPSVGGPTVTTTSS